MYLYIYTFTYVYIYIDMYIYLNIYINIYTFTCWPNGVVMASKTCEMPESYSGQLHVGKPKRESNLESHPSSVPFQIQWMLLKNVMDPERATIGSLKNPKMVHMGSMMNTVKTLAYDHIENIATPKVKFTNFIFKAYVCNILENILFS